MADAYYVLSDKIRRREYDALYTTRSPNEKTNAPDASSNFFANFASMFAGAAGAGAGAGAGTNAPGADGERQPDAEGVFADVFDDVSCFLSTQINFPMLTRII